MSIVVDFARREKLQAPTGNVEEPYLFTTARGPYGRGLGSYAYGCWKQVWANSLQYDGSPKTPSSSAVVVKNLRLKCDFPTHMVITNEPPVPSLEGTEDTEPLGRVAQFPQLCALCVL